MKRKHRHQTNLPAGARAVFVQGQQPGSAQPGKRSAGLGIGGPALAPRVQTWLLGLLLAAGVVFAYQPVWHAGYIWDDDAYVTENPLLTAPDGLERIWFSQDQPSQYFPLVYTSFRLEHTLWGLNPAGYHWVNILLHALNALLVWRLLSRLVPKLGVGAWLAAAIFALHPVQVETVAWITERKNLLSLLFGLLSLLAWVEFTEERPKPRWGVYALALVCCQLALFSKTTACTLPAALLLALWLKGRSIDWRRLLQVAPFVVLGLGMGLVTMWWERHNIGVQEKVQALNLLERILVASHAVWFYLGKLIWPSQLTFSYPRWTLDPGYPLAYGWLAACAAMAGGIWYGRRYAGRGLEVAALFFVATLSPLLGFIMLTTFRWSFVADHYQYVACLGPITLAVAGLVLALRRLPRPACAVGLAVCGGLLVVLGGLTYRQAGAYRGAESLWRDTLEKNPASWMAHINLGQILLTDGHLEEAMQHFRKALELQPENTVADNNIGSVLLQQGHVEEAMAHWRGILARDPGDPDANNNLAGQLFQQGHAQEAIAHWQKTLETRAGDPNANNNLGTAYLLTGQLDAAVVQFEKALKYNSDNATACNGLGSALARKGQIEKAIPLFRKAVQIQPNNAEAHYNLGVQLFQMGRLSEAVPHLQKVLELNPGDVQTLNRLASAAWVLATSPDSATRDGRKAVALAQQLNELSGGEDPTVLGALAAAYAETGDYAQAVATAQQALRVANTQTNATLMHALEAQIQLFKSGHSIHEAEQRRPATDPTQGK